MLRQLRLLAEHEVDDANAGVHGVLTRTSQLLELAASHARGVGATVRAEALRLAQRRFEAAAAALAAAPAHATWAVAMAGSFGSILERMSVGWVGGRRPPAAARRVLVNLLSAHATAELGTCTCARRSRRRRRRRRRLRRRSTLLRQSLVFRSRHRRRILLDCVLRTLRTTLAASARRWLPGSLWCTRLCCVLVCGNTNCLYDIARSMSISSRQHETSNALYTLRRGPSPSPPHTTHTESGGGDEGVLLMCEGALAARSRPPLRPLRGPRWTPGLDA